MNCPICQTPFHYSGDSIFDCSNCGAPIHSAQYEELSKEALIELSQRWKKWGKLNWQQQATTALEEVESPLLGSLAKHVSKFDKWILNNKAASAISNRISDRITSKSSTNAQPNESTRMASTRMESTQKESTQKEPWNTDSDQAESAAVNLLQVEGRATPGNTPTYPSVLQEESTASNTSDPTSIDEQTLIERYNKDVTKLKALLIGVKQTRASLMQYVQGLNKTIQLEADESGKYWAVKGDRTQNNIPLHFLLLRKDIRLNQQNFNTIKACFTFTNRAIPNGHFELIAPATIKPLPEEQRWELVQKGTIEFKEVQVDDET